MILNILDNSQTKFFPIKLGMIQTHLVKFLLVLPRMMQPQQKAFSTKRGYRFSGYLVLGSYLFNSIRGNIKKLQAQGRLRRIGPAKGGHWEVQ